MKGLCRFVALFDVGPGAVILPRSEAKLTWRGHRECAAATSSRLAYRRWLNSTAVRKLKASASLYYGS
jgi:hypothetical protein